ncbi:MAG: DUF2306 domain-containing protein [Alphaproteobacteria bacterium]|nr:DUF2306 domain-containing protein [Alphaproteobacteria bacterium]
MWPIALLIHVVCVTPALILGGYLLWGAKGSRQHRVLGWIWVVLMSGAIISAFFIHTLNQFYGLSWLHLLAIFSACSLILAVYSARRHRVQPHRRNMMGLYCVGLVGAGLFALLPARFLGKIIWSGWMFH